MKRSAAALAAVFFTCLTGAALGAELTIHVQNVLPSGGTLRLGLYTEALYPNDDSVPVASANIPAMAGETVVILRDVPPGTYAIETFQDVNSNDKMDTSWIGLPLEPFGFSRDARPFLSKPSFDKVQFTVGEGANMQIIHLQNSITDTSKAKVRDQIRPPRLQ